MNRTGLPLRAVAFDLDGTLVDSAPDIASVLNAALRGCGLRAVDPVSVRGWIGSGPDVLIELALKALGETGRSTTLPAKLRRAFDALTLATPLTHGSVFPGIKTALEQLAPLLPLVVVSNKPAPLARAVLAASELLPHFSQVFGPLRPEMRKPAPAMLCEAARKLSLDTPDLLMVGDSVLDMHAAQAAGSPAVLVSWGYGHQEALAARPRWQIDHPHQLLPIVRQATA